MSPPLASRATWVVGILAGVHLLIAAINLSPLMDLYTLDALINTNTEGTMVVWLSSTTLVVIAAIAFTIGSRAGRGTRERLGWWAVGGLFVVLSMDETASIHERVGYYASRYLVVDWLPGAYVWVIVLAPFAAVAAVWMVVFLGRTLGWRSRAGRLAVGAITLWVTVPLLEALDPAVGGSSTLRLIEETVEGLGEAFMLGAMLLALGRRPAAVGAAEYPRVDGNLSPPHPGPDTGGSG